MMEKGTVQSDVIQFLYLTYFNIIIFANYIKDDFQSVLCSLNIVMFTNIMNLTFQNEN